MKKEVTILKNIIDSNGLKYVSAKPYEVYEVLLNEEIEPLKARLILITLLSKTAEKAETMDELSLSEDIQEECCLTKDAADYLSQMYKELFSSENMQKWREEAGAGLKEFCQNEWHFQWDCTKKYHQSGAYVDCTCEVEAEFKVNNTDALKKVFQRELDENPFLSAETIRNFLQSVLENMLDDDVEEYVNGDDYYEPWMPDYNCEDVLDRFGKKYGLELLDYSCDGDTSDWQRDY